MTTFIGEIGLVSILYAVTCLGAFCVLVGAFCGITYHLQRLSDQYREASSIYRQAKQVTETQLGGVESLLQELDDLKAQTAWFDRITDRQPNWEYQ
jgi:hypothetical protein